MKLHKTQLEAKVSARNAVNALTLEMLPIMRAALLPLVGKKVLNQGHTISAKLKSVLPEREWTHERQVWYTASKYSVWACFKVCESFPSGYSDTQIASYAEQSARLCEIENDAIKSVTNGQTFRTDYTVAEVEAARKEVEAAEAVLKAAEEKLAGFGKYDN